MIVGRVLGLDPGDARVGVAVSDELGMLAHPRETLSVKDGTLPVARIAEMILAEKIHTVVVGLARNMDGTEGPAAAKSRALADAIQDGIGCPVVLWDERLTTVAAQKALHAAGRDTRKSRAVIDQVAAQIILQSYLDSRPAQ